MYALLAMLPADVRTNMVAMYREALVTQVAQLEQAVAATDDTALRDLAHKIAGSAGMMQNAALSRAARQMEIALREGRGDAARDAWPEVRVSVQRTLEALESVA
jgi:HPt (histidine-containing phosphotransfer) domain-containing protein